VLWLDKVFCDIDYVPTFRALICCHCKVGIDYQCVNDDCHPLVNTLPLMTKIDGRFMAFFMKEILLVLFLSGNKNIKIAIN